MHQAMQVNGKYGIILWMEKNYYENQICLIKEMIENVKWDEAYALVLEELSMPYVPKIAYDQLKHLESEIKANFKLNQKVSIIQDEEELKQLLIQDEIAQLKALDQMSRLNLRNYDTLVQDAFKLLKDRLFRNLLIRICIEQQLTDEFNFSDDGVEYAFIPASLCLPEDSEGVEEALKQLSVWLDQNPSLLNLCIEKVHYEALMALPVSYSEDEAHALAFTILEETFLQISDKSEWENFKNTHNLYNDSFSTH